MIEPYIIIEVLGNGGIRITTETASDNYINVSIKNAESQFREQYGLKGKRLRRSIQCRD